MKNNEKKIYKNLGNTVKHAWRKIYNKCIGKRLKSIHFYLRKLSIRPAEKKYKVYLNRIKIEHWEKIKMKTMYIFANY